MGPIFQESETNDCQSRRANVMKNHALLW